MIKKWRKSTKPPLEKLQSIRHHLKPGHNEVIFSVHGKSSLINGNIYLWDHDEKLVISDIDGTVTKSDILGHVLPRIGMSDWAHAGIAELYTNVRKNGYQFLYLSSRPIGFAEQTRKYLRSIHQE